MVEPADPQARKGSGFFGRLKERLQRTRDGFVEGIASLVLGRKKIDAELLEEIETVLLSADVGVDATRKIITDIEKRISRRELDDSDALFAALRADLFALLKPRSIPLAIERRATPFVILMVGVNGAGKTTTIGKLARRLRGEGMRVMLAAGDTFRAAAVEQLQAWGERNDIAVIAQTRSADPASVAFDAMQAAKARGMDVLIIDTAGRLHTQANLMAELQKVKRVIAKADPTAPHETMLVIDAGTGQNAVSQAAQFNDAVGLTGITLTKLDGTAKGGVIFAVASKLDVPIRFVGVGESIEDLRVFDAEEFVAALFSGKS
ncbi:MAG: signal recognition particle-docking protein FtsY [Chromatiales bacterium]|nr:signal recognition particle-docking protein FtsY [Chromatiales bacterium]